MAIRMGEKLIKFILEDKGIEKYIVSRGEINPPEIKFVPDPYLFEGSKYLEIRIAGSHRIYSADNPIALLVENLLKELINLNDRIIELEKRNG